MHEPFNVFAIPTDLNPSGGVKAEDCAPPSHIGQGAGGSKGVRSGRVKLPVPSPLPPPSKKRPRRPPRMVRAAVYCRVSTEDQEKGTSLDEQYRRCRSYCDQRGYRVVRAFREWGSGRSLDRAGLGGMLHHVAAGNIDVVVVLNRSRFARDADADGYLLAFLHRYDVRLEETDRGPQAPGPMTRFVSRIMAAQAELDSAMIAANLQKGRDGAARSGIWPMRATYGWRRERGGKGLTIHEAEAEHIRRLFRLVASGVSAQAASRRLGWTHQCSLYRLRNPAYKGLAHYNGHDVPVPAIVSEALWAEAQASVDALARAYGKTPRVPA